MVVPLYATSCFSPPDFINVSLSLTFDSIVIMWISSDSSYLNSLGLMGSISFSSSSRFSSTTYWNNVSAPFSPFFLDPYHEYIFVHFMMCHKSLKLYLFLFILCFFLLLRLDKFHCSVFEYPILFSLDLVCC